jgi:hypothetical protein
MTTPGALPDDPLEPALLAARLFCLAPRLFRGMVLRGSESPLGTWQQEQRDLRADFLRAFGDETTTVPPLMAVLVGADADNTGGHGLGWLQDLTLRP